MFSPSNLNKYFHLLVLFLVIFSSHLSRTSGDGSTFYKVPNPFKEKIIGYYHISSFHSTVSSENKRTPVEVDEYFSLNNGLSYSIHRNAETQEAFAIIGDGSRGRTYLVRNPDSLDQFECELDHLHHHRQIFPWQYVLEVEDKNAKKTKKKSRWATKRAIYGVGAIWLNAIARNVVSKSVQADSPYEKSNVWTMDENDMKITLKFDKPTQNPADAPLDKLIDSTKLNSIRLERRNAIEHRGGSTGSTLTALDIITIKKFDADVRLDRAQEDYPVLKRYFAQLARCRESTKKSRVFPNLLREVSESNYRSFVIDYLVRRYHKGQIVKPPKHGDNYDRKLWNEEFHSEWFSFNFEAQSTIIEGITDKKLDDGSYELDEESHLYLKRFTDLPQEKHTTAYYHITYQSAEAQVCKPGHAKAEPLERIFHRDIHFSGKDKQYTGRLDGLGALLMNAADIHYKEFSMFRKTIKVAFDPTKPDSTIDVNVDEWLLKDSKSSKTFHFFFKTQKSDYENHEMKDLVRIDVRNTIPESSDDPIENSDVDDSNDINLLTSYHILGFETDLDIHELERFLEVPEKCKSLPYHPEDSDSDSGYDTSDDSDDDWFANQHGDSDDEDSDDEQDQKENQTGGEDFEFEPGKVVEDSQFPNFYEFLDGNLAYRFGSKITMLDRDGKPTGKSVYMREKVDLDVSMATLQVFLSEQNFNDRKIDMEFYINYKSEVIFKVNQRKCAVVSDVDPWLRLFSAHLTYHRMAEGETASSRLDPHDMESKTVVSSSRIAFYGIGALWRRAINSDATEFAFARRKLVEGSDGRKYREVVWSMYENAEMVLHWTFLYDVQKSEQLKKAKKRRHMNELLSLKSIQVDELFFDSDETHFEKFRVDMVEFEASISEQWIVPFQCSAAIIEESNRKVYSYDAKVPSLIDVIRKTNAYITTYKVTHASEMWRANVMEITEAYDRNANMGKIITGPGSDLEQEIYIDGTKRQMFQYSVANRKCKRVTGVNSILGLPEDENTNFDLNKMYGLAGLWSKLANSRTQYMKVKSRLDGRGNRKEVREYKVTDEQLPSARGKYTIELTFVSSPVIVGDMTPDTTRLHVGEDVQLERIDFYPKSDRLKGKKRSDKPYHTAIDVHAFHDRIPDTITWQLPDECSRLAPSDDKPSEDGAKAGFPRLSNLINTQMHIRSELTTLNGLYDETEKHIFMMDEWLDGKMYRLKTYDLNSNIDVLVDGNNSQLFDLSQRYKCSNVAPQLGSMPPVDSWNLVTFWGLAAPEVDLLRNLYFGPLALWQLASAGTDGVKIELASQAEIAPAGDSTQWNKKSLERELSLEKWKVSNSKAEGQGWSYEMTFERVVKDKSEWHTLDSIFVKDASLRGVKTEVEVDVANYRWTLDESIREKLFVLPEGYGCKNNPNALQDLGKQKNVFDVDTRGEIYLYYESSLTVPAGSKGPKTKENSKMFNLNGNIIRSGAKPKRGPENVFLQNTRLRHINGSIDSSLKVYESSTKAMFLIDGATGKCTMDESLLEPYWELRFSDTSDHYDITLDDRTFKRLFLDDSDLDFKPLNRFTLGRHSYINYEATVDSFELVKGRLVGPASIIRTFMTFSFITAEISYNNEEHVRVIIFNSDRTEVRADFQIRLRDLNYPMPIDLIRSNNLMQCYNDVNSGDRRIGSYIFEYHIEPADLKWAHANVQQLEADMVAILVQEIGLRPHQLDGDVKILFDHGNSMQIHVNLLDAPTAIGYFQRRWASRMTSEMELLAEFKLAATFDECSQWCDALDCVAMSFCVDHTCRVLTKPKATKEESSLSHKMMLSAYTKDDSCSYFFVDLDDKILTLEKFASTLNRDVNVARLSSRLENLTLKLPRSTAYPVLFKEMSKELDFYGEDVDATGLLDIKAEPKNEYVLAGRNKMIQIEDFSKFKQQFGSDVQISDSGMSKYGDCVRACDKINCLIGSYCTQNKFCVILAFGNKSPGVRKLMDIVEGDRPNCFVFVRDPTARYKKFARTLMPTKSLRQIDGLTYFECAEACEAESTCLSFDSCDVQSKRTGGVADTSNFVCYLQSMHVMMDSFDRTIFTSKWFGALSEYESDPRYRENDILCDHYSKSMVADYGKTPNMRFNQRSTANLMGAPVDRCALECSQDNQCIAFEYCVFPQALPAQACYFVKSADLKGADIIDVKNLQDVVQSQLKISKTCSVYTRMHFDEKFEMNKRTSKIELVDQALAIIRHEGSLKFGSFVAYLLGAIVVGSIIQLAYIKLFGRAAIFGG